MSVFYIIQVMITHPSESTIETLTPAALRRNVVAKLMRSIFQGELPPGTKLVVQKLALRFGVSPTPVREALLELESAGMIQFIHNRGAVVKPVGPQEIQEIYHVRRVLETEATRAACGRIPLDALCGIDRDLKQLLTDLERGTETWSERAMETDRRLHELIISNSGNRRLANEIRRYYALIESLRVAVGNERQAQLRAVHEHLALTAALLSINVEQAAAAMERHIHSTARSVVAVMFK